MALSFMRGQIPCDSKSTFCDCKVHFSGYKEEDLDLIPCYSASVL